MIDDGSNEGMMIYRWLILLILNLHTHESLGVTASTVCLVGSAAELLAKAWGYCLVLPVDVWQ